jgi:hypothetical protein
LAEPVDPCIQVLELAAQGGRQFRTQSSSGRSPSAQGRASRITSVVSPAASSARTWRTVVTVFSPYRR